MTGLNGDDPDDYYLNLNQDEESLLRSRHSVGSGAPHRQGSLVRPERSRLNNPDNRVKIIPQKTQEQMNHLDVLPSSTGVNPNATRRSGSLRSKGSVRSKFSGRETDSYLLQDMNTTDKKASVKISDEGVAEDEFDKDGDVDNFEESSTQPINKSIKPLRKETNDTLSFWQMYCYFITFWAPAPILAFCGMPKKERQMAWREKVALISVILYIGAIVAFLTFGFTKTVCSSSKLRLKNNEVSTEFVVINGKAYELDTSSRSGIQDVEVDSDTLYGPWSDAGKDASFLFQNVNGNCHNLITPKSNSSIPHLLLLLNAWYFPCKLKNQDGSSKPNFTVENYAGWNCHTSKEDRDAFYGLKSKADVYFTWDGIKNSSRNLIVYNGDVLDLDLLDWLEKDDVDYPVVFDDLKTSNLQGYDLSLVLSNGHERKIARCLSEIIKVGEVDSKTVGCIASDVVLYVSLVFILSVVIIKFIIACYFRWTVARKQGAYIVDNKTMDKHTNDIEDWSNNIQTKAPLKEVDPHLRPKKYSKKSLGHKRASTFDLLKKHSSKMFQFNESVIDLDTSMSSSLQSSGSYRGMTTMTTQNAWKLSNENKAVHSRNPSTLLPTSSMFWNKATSSPVPGSSLIQSLDSTIIHPDIVQQPPLDFMPYGFPLIHTICFVTCYSEDEEGLRTTLDSLSTTDYPNSHKLLMVVCDGLIKGSGNDKTTPEIALGMMDDFVTPPDEVKPYSYVAVASGSKRHNMAKIYAGFYKYDDSTIPPENQQRVPIITIVKCGTPAEQGAAKPGNRGKRDSQIILMSKNLFYCNDERMTQLEFHENFL